MRVVEVHLIDNGWLVTKPLTYEDCTVIEDETTVKVVDIIHSTVKRMPFIASFRRDVVAWWEEYQEDDKQEQ